jgi:putative restriction endonuclease
MKGVLFHKKNSIYNDVKGTYYHFPEQYIKRIEKMINDFFVYYEIIPDIKGRYYTGCGMVSQIRPDPKLKGHHYADLINFIDFDRMVPYRENGGYEEKLVRPDGSVNRGTAQNAVRLITEYEFARIISAGLSEKPTWPNRTDDHHPNDDNEIYSEFEFSEFARGQPPLIGAPFVRPIVSQLLNRKWRDKKFRYRVLKAYNRTCAFTGLRLINGRGRPEVEAAHIRPVEHGGNDWIRNGIALSGTIHWMFDRGLLSLGDNYEILQSRKLNHDISGLLVKGMTAIVPKDEGLKPHLDYVKWHRIEHGF